MGEGQALGNGLNFGGPYLGFFACRQKHVRKMAGRLVGQTVDAEGKRGFVLTLATREQHIRRERATSNICTNQALWPWPPASTWPPWASAACASWPNSATTRPTMPPAAIAELEGYPGGRLTSPSSKSLSSAARRRSRTINDYLLEEWGIIGGYDLGRDYPDLENHMLLCVTEVISREEIDALVEALAEAAEEVAR